MINAKRFAASLLTLVLLLLAAPAWSATFTVNSVNDVLDVNPGDGVCETGVGNGVCTLRAAIGEANALGGNNTINISAGTYTISLAGSEDNNLNGDFDITQNVAIVGAGAGSTIIDGGGIDRVFHIVWSITVSISGVTIQNGSAAAGGGGGGIWNDGGSVTVTNSTISGNTVANNDGGGIYNTATGTLTVTNSTIGNNNTAGSGNGGGILNQGTATVTNSTISGNTAAADGGGIYSGIGTLTVTNSAITSNSATTSGGGIFNWGTLEITNSTFSGNSVTNGGGIYNDVAGTLTITNSAFSGNSVTNGGGILNVGTATATNSTFSGNSAVDGGGILNVGTATVINSTFSGNSAADGGGIRNDPTGTVTLKNTIVANSTSGGNCSGTITDGGNNLDSANTCGFTANAIINSDPMLGPLAGNGGATQTFALLAGSPAIDAGGATTCSNSPVNNLDQRGITRPQGATCDIGAFESNAQSAPAFIVNVTADTDDGSCDALVAGITDCTLREAIIAANALSSDDTITFSVSGTITLGSQLPTIVSGQGTLTINGGGNITISGNNASRVFFVNSSSSLSLQNLTIANGDSSGDGGGIHNFGTLTISNSTFSGNSAEEDGGGIRNSGTLTISNSTFINNTAYSLTNGNGGGGIFGGIGTTTTISNSTFSGNHTSVDGGGIRISAAGSLTITNSTFSGNSATGNGGGIRNHSTGTVTLKNTIVANSSSGGNCSGTITNGGNNIDDGTTCGWSSASGSMSSTNPNLGALTGSPAYFPLNTGSPAIDAGTNTGCPTPSQNGITRPSDGDGNGTAICDIGSYEAPDTTPNAFSFTAQTGVALSTVTTSNAITLSGINAASLISIVGGTYSINGGVYTSGAGTVNDGDTVTLRQTSSGSYATLTTATLSIGGVSGAFDVTTYAVPGAPTIGTATAGNAQATVTFTAPASDGGSVITGYTVTSNPGGITATGAASPITVTGLTNGTAYTFTVTATNAVGTGAASAPSNSVTPAGVPGAPIIGTATAGNAQATVTFTAPASDGGSVITGYTATCNPGVFTASGAGSPLTVTGLANGTAYLCSVTATNVAGTSAASATVNVTPSFNSYTGPSATGTGNVTASFTGGGAGCGYTTVQFIPLTGNPASPPAGTAPAVVTFPHGLFDFTTGGCTPGSTITITITWPSALPAGTQYWKYGPTPTNAVPHWYVLPAAIAGNVTTFSITDGALGDDDLLANGTIVDQGGPGGGGGAGGAASVPTLSEWAMMALALLLGFLGMRQARPNV